MKKGQVYEGIVERVDFPNKGIVRVGEDTVIVKNGLPGQKVKFSINKVRKGKAEGRLLEVMEKSPRECSRTCSHFGMCGGCTYLSLPYKEQLAVKEQQVKRLLDQVLDTQEPPYLWEGIKGSPLVYGYRNKMEFSFGDEYKDGPLALGMHKRGSFYDVVTVEDCEIVDADYRLILNAVRDYFAEKNVSFFHRMQHKGYLRHLLVRKASRTGEILAALVTTSENPWKEAVSGQTENERTEQKRPESGRIGQVCIENGQTGREWTSEEGKEQKNGALQDQTELIRGFCRVLLQLEQDGRLEGRFAGILHIVNDSLADVVKSDHTEILYGQDYFYEELLGLKFKISTFSFFQTNTYGAEVLYQTAREYVGDLKDFMEEERLDAQDQGAESRETFERKTEVVEVENRAYRKRETGDTEAENEDDDRNGMNPAGRRGKIVFDLYSGTGTIAQLMAPVAEKVIGVEIVEEAVEAAKRNAADNGLQNCEFIAGDVLKMLDEIAERPDLIILDPPRDGIHPKALPKIIHYGVERIVYISCKPTSLVRDLEVFLANGYRVEKAVAIDQFPWTANVETCCLLVRECAHDDEMVSIKVDLEGISLDQGKF